MEELLEKYKNRTEETQFSEEELKQIINFLEAKIESLNKTLDSAFKQTRELNNKHRNNIKGILAGLNNLADKNRMDYHTTLLLIKNIEGGIDYGD